MRDAVPFEEWDRPPTEEQPWVCEFDFTLTPADQLHQYATGSGLWDDALWHPCFAHKKDRYDPMLECPQTTFATLDEAVEAIRDLQSQYSDLVYRIRHAFLGVVVPLKMLT